MKKLILVNLYLALLLSACGGLKATSTEVKPTETKVMATVANDDGARATQAIVDQWLDAIQKRDAKLFLSFYSDSINWTMCSLKCSSLGIDTLKTYVPRDFSRASVQMNILSYTVLNNGVFAIVQGVYQDTGGDAKEPTPLTIILEFSNGMIITETWYFIMSY